MEDDDPRPRKLSRRDVNARKETEAGPSVAMEESVVDKPRLGRVEQKHSIFLSHSGAQKAFVRRLRNALERNAYLPFFDEDPDSLAKGEPFVQHLKDAARLADVAIVVLSDDFFNSKWPMIELAIFIEAQRRRKSVLECKELNIIPLFMGVSVEEFRNRERRLEWLNKWYELGAADNRIDASKWEDALGVLGGIHGIKYSDFKTEEEYINSIVAAIFKLVPPDLKWEDTHVKGKLKLHQAVAEMFAKAPSRTRFHNVRTIGLYGMGGLGKTTICKSLCNDYFAEFSGKVWHVELGKKGVEEIQKDVLRHLVGISENLLNYTMKCKDQWRRLLRRKIEQKVFLAIDNVWNEDIYREQAEAFLGMGFHPDSLVIVTSRSHELLEWLGIHKDCCFEMPELDQDDATAVVLQSAAPGCDIGSMTVSQRAAVDKVVEYCFLTKGPISGARSEKQYVPLALEVLGRQLRLPLAGTPARLKIWVNKLDLKRSYQKQHPIFSVLRLSYDNLPSSKHKSIFLDVALCAPRQQDNTSASVNEVCKWLSMVYRVDADEIWEFLEDLQRDGLVERWECSVSPFGVHELYSEFAKAEAAREENSDKQLYLYHEDGLDVPSIMQMLPRHNYWPLRRVQFYNGGFSELSSGELQYMVHVEVLKLDFCFELKSLDLRCLKSLRSLEIRGCFELRIVEGLKDLKHLKFFRWNTCRISKVALDFPQLLELVEIYGSKESEGPAVDSLEQCSGLLELTLSRHLLLRAVPDLHKFPKLEKVDFSGCCRIEEVRGLEGLCRLKHLNLQNCKKLHHCFFLEKLVTIETLNLEGCEIIPEVWNLTQLINLRCINIGGSLVVQELEFNSPQLEQLGVIGCVNLRKVVLFTNSWKCLNRLNKDWPETARQWTFDCPSVTDRNSTLNRNETLNLSNCHTLESLGDIGSLRSLQHLILQNCSMVTALPGVWDLSKLSSLRSMDISGNHSVRELVLGSPLLQQLNIEECANLRTVVLCTNSWKCLNRLNDYWGGKPREWTFVCRSDPGRNSFEAYRTLNLSNCDTLENLSDIGSLRSLKYLILQNCRMLTTLPNLSNSPFLEVLDLSRCSILQDLSAVGPLSALQNLYLWGCGSLTSLGDLGSPSLKVLVLSGCSKLESLGDMGSLRSLRDLYIGNCGMLTTLPDLSNSHFLEVLDLSRCSTLQNFGHTGRLRALQYLYLRGCESLTSLEILGSPSLNTLDLTGCSKLERLGIQDSLGSLQNLHLSDCKSVTILPDVSHCSTLEVLDLKGCVNIRVFSQMARQDVWDLSELVSLRVINVSDNQVVRKLVVGSTQLMELNVDGCTKLVTVALPTDPESWKILDRINGLGIMLPERLEPQKWTVNCRSGVARNSFEGYRTLNLSNCHTLQSLGDMGSLRSLQELYLQNCRMLTTLPDLSNSPFLEVLNLSRCSMLQDLSDVGPLRALKILDLQECGSLTSLEILGSPSLNTLDLSGCSKLESLGDMGSLRSLQELYLGNCRMLTTLPDFNHLPSLEVLGLSGCSKFESLGDMGSLRSLRDLYLGNCRMLTTLPDFNHLPSLEVLDLWGLSKFESLGDMGSLRSLRDLYLGNCRMLTMLPDLSHLPSLEVLDLSGCSKLEWWRAQDSLGSLQKLCLSDYASFRNIPNLNYFYLRQVMAVLRCLRTFPQMSTRSLFIDASKLRGIIQSVILAQDGTSE